MLTLLKNLNHPDFVKTRFLLAGFYCTSACLFRAIFNKVSNTLVVMLKAGTNIFQCLTL